MLKKQVVFEEAKNKAARENLRLILKHGDEKTQNTIKKLISDAARQVRVDRRSYIVFYF